VNNRQKLISVLTSVFLAALTACGGGGGGEPVNSAPVATAQSVVTTQNNAVDITLRGTDANGDSLSYAIASDPANGTLSGTAPQLTYTPDDEFSGEDSFTFTVNDGTVTSAAATITIRVQDVIVDAFAFTDQINVALEQVINSNAIVISGINTAVDVSISGGEYAINGGAFTTDDGSVNDGDSLVVRLTSSAMPLTRTETTLTVGSIEDIFSVTTLDPADRTPNAFSFTDRNDALSGEVITSNAVVISGIDVPVEVSISGGEYAINGGAFTSDNGTAAVNDSIVVRLTASEIGLETTEATLVVGGVSGTFSVTTANDLTPDPFTFIDQTEAASGEAIASNAVVISGINNAVAVAISGGEYSINGGAFTVAEGTTNNNDSIVVRLISAVTASETATVTLTVSGISANFNVTTANDTTPSPFSFTDQIDVPASETIESNPIVVSGINGSATVSIIDGDYSINDGEFTDRNGVVNNGDSIIVEAYSSNVGLETVDATLNVGGVSDTFSVTTINDITPDAFSFTDRPEVAPGDVIVSDYIEITGINNVAPITIIGGEYSINGGPFTADDSTVGEENEITVRLTASTVAFETAETTLTVGGVSDTFSVVTSNDTTAPTATILFPSGNALTDKAEVSLRGTATDDGTIDTVTVNGKEGIIDESNNWIVHNVPLLDGFNELTVEVTDLGGNTNTNVSSVTVESRPLFRSFSDIHYDESTSRLLLLGAYAHLYDFTPSTMSYSSISSNYRGTDDINPMSLPRDLDVDETTNTAYVIDALDNNTKDRILSVNLATGERSVVTEDAESVPAHTLLEPNHLEMDTVNNFVYVLDGTAFSRMKGRGAILRFDLGSGEAKVVSSVSGLALTQPDSIALDKANNRILLVETFGTDSIIAVDLDTGERSYFSRNGTPDFNNNLSSPKAITLDVDNNRALVIDIGTDNLIAISLETGSRTVIAENVNIPRSDNARDVMTDMVYDSVANRVFIIRSDGAAVYAVDLATGELSVFSDNTTPDTVNPLASPTGLTIDNAANRLLVTNSGSDAVIAVDLTTGARTIVSDSATPSDLNPLSNPRGIGIGLNNTAYLVDSAHDSLMRVDLTTGARTIISDNSIPDANNTFSRLESITVEEAGNQSLVLDSGRKALIRVDNDTAERVVISDLNTPNEDNPLVSPQALILEGDRGLVLDLSTNSIVNVDLTTGARTIFSGNGIPDNTHSLLLPSKMVLDSDNSRLLVLDRRGVKAVSLVDGSRTILSGNGIPDSNNPFSSVLNLADITLDEANNKALVLDATYDVVFAVDLTTGERTIYAGGTPNQQPVLNRPGSVLFDVVDNKFLVADSNALFKVDAVTGKREIFSSLDVPANNSEFRHIRHAVLDFAKHRVLTGSHNSLIEIDLDTGLATLISGSNFPDNDNPFSNIQSLALDSANNRVFITDYTNKNILAVNLTTGVRTVLSSDTVPDDVNPLSSPRSIVFDEDNGRLLVQDSNNIVAVDVVTGERTLFSTGNSFWGNGHFLLDKDNGRLLYPSRGAFYAVNLSTGGTATMLRQVSQLISNEGATLTSNPDQLVVTSSWLGLVIVDLVTGERVILSK